MSEVLELKQESQLQHLEEESCAGPVLLYKHSSRCGTSTWAQRELEAFRREAGAEAPLVAELDVVEHRALAQEVARRYGVRHQSPQLLLLRDRQVVWHGSHDDLERSAIAAAVTSSARATVESIHQSTHKGE